MAIQTYSIPTDLVKTVAVVTLQSTDAASRSTRAVCLIQRQTGGKPFPEGMSYYFATLIFVGIYKSVNAQH